MTIAIQPLLIVSLRVLAAKQEQNAVHLQQIQAFRLYFLYIDKSFISPTLHHIYMDGIIFCRGFGFMPSTEQGARLF